MQILKLVQGLDSKIDARGQRATKLETDGDLSTTAFRRVNDNIYSDESGKEERKFNLIAEGCVLPGKAGTLKYVKR